MTMVQSFNSLKMKRTIIFSLVILAFSFDGFSQGVIFEKDISWKALLDKAKKEKKYIFIDAFTTWCGPCRKMDQEVYINDSLGKKINDRFISVKVQMDQTKNDNEFVKSWYADAQQLTKRYAIDAFPTFLFLIPNGELTYRNIGYKNVDQFYSMIEDVVNPKLNYAAKVAAFKLHRLKLEDMEWLAITASQFKEDSLAKVIAQEYKSRYLNKQKASAELIKRHAKFIIAFQPLFSTSDRMVQYFYKNKAMADSAIGFNGFSREFTDYMIQNHYYPFSYKESIKPRNYAWQKIFNEVKERYDEKTAIRIELSSKAMYYTTIKDWPNAVKYEIAQVENNEANQEKISPSGINNLVFEVIFAHATSKEHLKKGQEFMEKFVLPTDASANHIDTYANVLYKMGNKNAAIQQEQQALVMAQNRKDQEAIKSFTETLAKMRVGQPTWE